MKQVFIYKLVFTRLSNPRFSVAQRFIAACITTHHPTLFQANPVDVKSHPHSWLRHFATSRKVAGSISDGVYGIFQ